MAEEKYNLNRFLKAQEGMYNRALKELQNGRKRSHWMWYIFPQLKHLGHSFNAKFYGLSGLEEARTYLMNPVLNNRLREVSGIILALDTNDACEIFGDIDSYKLRSSMTLFDLVSPNDIFSQVIEKFYDNKRDRRTINIVNYNNGTI